MNPHWIANIYRTLKDRARTCPHCGKRAVYPVRRPGQFHICKHCHRRFKEKEN